MQIALYGSIAWRHPMGFSQVIEWARQFGWDAVDARGMSLDVIGDTNQRLNAFGYDMLGPRQIRKSARHDLAKRLQDTGISLLGIYCSSPINLPGELGDVGRALFRDYLQLGSDLGVKWIRAINNNLSDGIGGAMTAEEAYDRTVEGLAQMAKLASDLGVGLLLENNENTTTPDADSLLRVIDDLGSMANIGITYDPVNAYCQGTDVSQGFVKLAGKIDVLHVKNVRRWQEKRWDYVPRGDFSYEWTDLQSGDLQWADLIPKAIKNGFVGPIVYEYVNPFKGMPLDYWDTLPEPKVAAETEAEFLRLICKN